MLKIVDLTVEILKSRYLKLLFGMHTYLYIMTTGGHFI